MMLINRLRLTNFRGIREGSIELSPITVLLGSNNSGKSTILEALFLAPNPTRYVPYYPKELQNIALNVLHERHKTLGSQGYAFLLHNYVAEESHITCYANNEGHSLNLLVDHNQIILTTDKETQAYGSYRYKGSDIKSFGRALLNSTDTNIYITEPFIIEETLLVSPNISGMGFQYMRENWPSIINKGICRRVAKDSSNVSPEKYIDITMEPFFGGNVEIFAFLEDGRRIRLGDLGEGIQSYMLSRMLYEIVKPKVLLWDDIESHLNPRILRHLAEWFSDLLNEGRQVVLSTHSIEATKIIAGVNEEKTGIYLTALDNSILRTKKFTLSELEDLQNAGIDARTAEAVLL